MSFGHVIFNLNLFLFDTWAFHFKFEKFSKGIRMMILYLQFWSEILISWFSLIQWRSKIVMYAPNYFFDILIWFWIFSNSYCTIYPFCSFLFDWFYLLQNITQFYIFPFSVFSLTTLSVFIKCSIISVKKKLNSLFARLEITKQYHFLSLIWNS